MARAACGLFLPLFLGSALFFGPAAAGQDVGSGKGSGGAPVVRAEEIFVLTGSPGAPFRQPTDVAVDRGLRLHVLDGLNGRVVVFDRDGRYIRSFGSVGSGPAELLMPVGIGISPSGEVYVADSGNHRLQVFGPDGRWLRSLALATGGKADPTDVLVSPAGDLCYVCDNDNHQIQVYDTATGALRRRWGGYGKNLGEFRYPATLAGDDRDQIYVVDVLNARVQTFDQQGRRGREIAVWGVGLERVFRPKGVALDRKRRAFVSDSYEGLIKVFENSGPLAGVVGDGNGDARKFAAPTNLVIDAAERLAVVETRASRVSVWRVIP
ncbi:MAG: NHL repeat-containing protein [bacterium]